MGIIDCTVLRIPVRKKAPLTPKMRRSFEQITAYWKRKSVVRGERCGRIASALEKHPLIIFRSTSSAKDRIWLLTKTPGGASWRITFLVVTVLVGTKKMSRRWRLP